MPIASKIRQELRQNSNAVAKASEQRFFKEKIKLYGVKAALVAKIAKKYSPDVLALPKDKVFALCDDLWQSGYLEETFVACHFSYLVCQSYQPKDFKVFEKWVNCHVANWASCDTLCNHTIGFFIDRYPQFLKNLKKWTRSQNRWVKRAAAVTLIIPARHGKFLKEVFEIADNLLLDSDDMVQKGYGWLLKVASQAHQQEVFNYVMQNKEQMPRTALRYAIEKMPFSLKNEAMKK